jgi:arabinogalactan oligomer/maltooligosaccharide transport system permease protein
MGVTYRGLRKYLIVLFFIAPTLLGVLMLNVFPILFNVYISFTNRNTYHYQTYEPAPEERAAFVEEHPALGAFAWDVLCPVMPALCCSPDRMMVYCLREPFYDNYVRLFEELFTTSSLTAMGKLVLTIVPLIAVSIAAGQVRKRTLSPPATWWWWLVAAALGVGLWFLLDARAALELLFDTGSFFVVMFRTVLYVVACIPFFFVFGLIFALLLNNEWLRGKGIWRVLIIVPWAVPSYISALIWQFFFRTEQGTINQLLGILGVQGPSWLLNPGTAFFAVVLVNIWMSYPFFMVIILGALQAIPTEQYEAAEVDGATWFQQLFNITLPLLRPAVMPAIVLSSITTFQMFNTVWLITQGGPIQGAGVPGATEFVMVHAYKQVFQSRNDGLIGAFAVIVFIILFAATLYSMRVTRITQGAYE